MIFRLTVSVRSLDWWSQGSTMHTTTWETTMLMCSRRKLQTRCHSRLNQNWLPHSQIAENQPGTLLVTIDSKKLSANIESPSLIVQQHSDGILLTVSQDVLPDLTFLLQFRQVATAGQKPGSTWAWRSHPCLCLCSRSQEDLQVLPFCTALPFSNVDFLHRDLVDFDTHLDDLSMVIVCMLLSFF